MDVSDGDKHNSPGIVDASAAILSNSGTVVLRSVTIVYITLMQYLKQP
jgi:hypothetical protein